MEHLLFRSEMSMNELFRRSYTIIPKMPQWTISNSTRVMKSMGRWHTVALIPWMNLLPLSTVSKTPPIANIPIDIMWWMLPIVPPWHALHFMAKFASLFISFSTFETFWRPNFPRIPRDKSLWFDKNIYGTIGSASIFCGDKRSKCISHPVISTNATYQAFSCQWQDLWVPGAESCCAQHWKQSTEHISKYLPCHGISMNQTLRTRFG